MNNLYLVDVKNLAGGLLHLSDLMHEIPETRLGVDLVGSKDLHAVCRRIRIGIGGSLAADDLVETHLRKSQSLQEILTLCPFRHNNCITTKTMTLIGITHSREHTLTDMVICTIPNISNGNKTIPIVD